MFFHSELALKAHTWQWSSDPSCRLAHVTVPPPGAPSPLPSPLRSVYAVCAKENLLSGLPAPVLPQLLGAALLRARRRTRGCGVESPQGL